MNNSLKKAEVPKEKLASIIYSKKVQNESESIFKFLDYIKLDKRINQDQIYIKPNFMIFTHPEHLNYTSPLLINSVCEYIENLGYKDFKIIESEVYYSSVYKNHNVVNIAKKIGINPNFDVMNLSKQPTVDFIYDHRNLTVPKVLDRQDNNYFLLNLPKFKVLGHFCITCAIKNIYGCYSTYNKFDEFHRKWHVEKAIGAIHHFTKPDFTIIDGIETQDCPNQHLVEKKRNYCNFYGYLFASDNPYAIDLLICDIIDLNPKIVKYLDEVKDIYISDYTIEGDIPEKLKFKLPRFYTRFYWRKIVDSKFWSKKFIENNIKRRCEKYIFDKEIFSN
ncbi:MAG: DUF362 domain-containing protein [Promethearchaeota archaeon]